MTGAELELLEAVLRRVVREEVRQAMLEGGPLYPWGRTPIASAPTLHQHVLKDAEDHHKQLVEKRARRNEKKQREYDRKLKQENPLMDSWEAATFLETSINALYEWRSRGKGPAFTKVGRSVHYHLSDLKSFAQDGLRR